MTNIKSSNSGYTLLETLVALSMLLIIAAPMLSGVFRNNHAIESERIIIGISLLEQEARRITADPDEMLPIKKRNINGREWVITGAKTGAGVIQYHLEVALDNKKYGEIYFLDKERKSGK
jgi:prepilin-type N-terminal cleavage/methylation domain-containing protein